jgi:hypothetical protein
MESLFVFLNLGKSLLPWIVWIKPRYLKCICRDIFGDTSILGDKRWAGSYGVDANFIAGKHCCIARVSKNHIQVNLKFILSQCGLEQVGFLLDCESIAVPHNIITKSVFLTLLINEINAIVDGCKSWQGNDFKALIRQFTYFA